VDAEKRIWRETEADRFTEFDRRLLEGRLPPAIFYNLMLAARKPR